MYVPRRANALRGLPGLDSRLAGSIGVFARDRYSPIEDWHIVGEHGEPQFRRNLDGVTREYYEGPGPYRRVPVNWDSHSSYSPVAFFRDTAGMVHLRGGLERTGGWTAGSYTVAGGRSDSQMAFAMPFGYRPAFDVGFECAARGEALWESSTSGSFLLEIWSGYGAYTPGRVWVETVSPSTIWLDGLMYPADPAEIPPNVVPN